MADHSRHPPHEATRLPHVGTYRRVLPVSIERLYENAVDWAHLPHLHSGSFSAIRCLAAGAWGFRAAVETPAGGTSVIELSLDRRLRRWITRTLEGRNAGAEIWTHAFPVEPRRTDIVVDFFVPDVDATARARVGTAFADLYTRLYDEDEAMMVERQRQLDRRIDSAEAPSEAVLGRVGALDFPRVEPYRGHDFWIVREGDALRAYAAQCPHMLGPLPDTPAPDGTVTCPWHGYRFDVETGACLSEAPCRLLPAPNVRVAPDGTVALTPLR
jgi:nitrite reductase/ring-hydroxylating ferredoxin subunit